MTKIQTGENGILIRCGKLTRDYGGGNGSASSGARAVHALKGVDLEIARGDFVAITGPSGCGKSTLLNLLGALDTPTSGTLEVDGLRLDTADEKARIRYRRNDVGIVFQFFNLMPTMTVEENVMLPLLLKGVSRPEAKKRAAIVVESVGLAARARHFISELSGGEMQRAAVSRALIHEPKLIIADEPTGNLDTASADQVMALFEKIHAEGVATVVMVTHSRALAERARRRIRMRDGGIEDSGGAGAAP